MRLILSRKGFDSAAGGCANPILPDGRLVSLPIPDPDAPVTYGDLGEMGRLALDLARGKLDRAHGAHLDPHLPTDGPGLFGQHGAAAGHLRKCGLAVGDLFLFFGWFRAVAPGPKGWAFVKGAPDLHVCFGWLQVGRLWDLGAGDLPAGPAYADHPHLHGQRGAGNLLCEGAPRLTLPRAASGLPGAGLFPRLVPEAVLTEPGARRGIWRLPAFFHPEGRASALTYHGEPGRWTRTRGGVRLNAAFRGQEFVLDADHYPEAAAWAASLITRGAGAAEH